MRFYDLGDNDYDMASPYRLHIPERGLELSYGKPGAMVFITTNGYQDDYGREVAGRCVFGTDNERAHANLKKKLGQGERITMRGVLWPEYDVMTVWETFSNMSEFRELMKVVAGGLRDELELNPEDVLLYLGYSHPARGEERDYDMYNVELSVGEACVVGGHGDVNDCFYAMFLKDKATRKDNGDIASNGMRNRDMWRHYEVVGESTLFSDIVREVLKEGLETTGDTEGQQMDKPVNPAQTGQTGTTTTGQTQTQPVQPQQNTPGQIQNNPAQQPQQQGQQQPQQSQPQQQQESVKIMLTDPEQSKELGKRAKEVVSQAQSGQLDTSNPEVRLDLARTFAASFFWRFFCRLFGWDENEGSYDGETSLGLSSANPNGDEEIALLAAKAEFSGSSLTSSVILSPNRTPRRNQVTKITIHHMAGVGTAEKVGGMFQKKGRRASANYGIGNDGKIVMYVPEDFAAWTSSSSKNDHQAITIEVSNSQVGGQWPVGDAALKSLVALCKDICNRYGITPSYTGNASGTFTTHKMFANTTCPGPYIESLLRPQNGKEGWLIRAIKGNV